jgi:hypothetical protein
MLTKSFVLVVVAIGVVLSIAGSWGIAALASSHSANVPTSSATGVAGNAGSNGKNGATGETGAAGIPGLDGANGAAGTAGARGLSGAQGDAGTNGVAGALGLTGAQGDTGAQGPAGPSGASAPTFSATLASGGTLELPSDAFIFPAQTAFVPSGPALVGFSVGLQSIFPVPFPISCSLVDADNPDTVFATTAGLAIAAPPSLSTFATTQVVNLTAPTRLTVQCISSPAFSTPGIGFENLSIYAISFAP